VTQLEHTSRDQLTSWLGHGKSACPDQRADSLKRDPYQSVDIDGIPHHAVIGLLLAKRGMQ
jgi:hypothetical protein